MGVPINLMGVLESLASENSPYAHSKLETSEELQPSKPQKSKKKKKKHKSFVEPENEIKVEVLETYFEDIKMVRKLLVSLDDVLDDLGEKYVEQIEAVSNRAKERAGRDIAELTKTIKNEIVEVRTILEELSHQFDHSSEQMQDRIKRNAYSSIYLSFYDILQRFHGMQSRFQEQTREMIKTQVRIVNQDITDEELDEMIESGDADKIFQHGVAQSQRKKAAEAALRYVQDKHNEILKLQDSILELYEMMLDMTVLVNEQHEKLGKIATHVSTAKVNVQKGTDHVFNANKYQKQRCVIS
eukprot:TRINITY_DN5469_c0_g2_i2.p1 TRINITY_DN5469_c0_g2~~TRINITY_DN5469_c0_g2_i2.p1  ORF type:complete len:299 (-),score=70.53 TRINITY_DN5469_c0_g2_i2:116-1012(-)